MPYLLIGRDVKRCSITKDQWVVDVTVMCSDRVPPGDASPMLLDVAWRKKREDQDLPDVPDDARPVVVSLRQLSPHTGDIAFDPEGTARARGFTGDRRVLLNMYALRQGNGGANGSPDVELDVSIEDKVRKSIPLIVGPLPAKVEVRAGNGVDPAQEALPPGQTIQFSAQVDPEVEGDFRWDSVNPAALQLGDREQRAVAVSAHPTDPPGPDDYVLCVLFTPRGEQAPAVMAVHRARLADALIYRGRVLDSIEQPVNGVEVIARARSGQELGRTATAADGRFEVRVALVDELVLVFRSGAVELEMPRSPARANPAAIMELGDIRMRLPLTLGGTVGDGGANAALDVRRVQDRLHHLGRLTDADVAAEPVNVAAAGPVNAATIPRLIAALYAQLQAALGRRLPQVHPGDPTLDVLNADPPFALSRIVLTQPVGELPGAPAPAPAVNLAPQARAVQERLYQLGFLPEANYLAERVDPAAVPANIPAANLAQTIRAIRVFETTVASGALRAFAQDRINLRLLNDPYTFGRVPMRLIGPVGAAGENRPADVRAVQDRLREIGLLPEPDYRAELVPWPDPAALAPAPVAEAAIAQTIAAVAYFRETVLAVPAPAPGRVDLEDPALELLNRPPRVDLGAGVGQQGGDAALVPNAPRDVRAVQDRLRALRFLANADHDAERVNPAGLAGVDVAAIPRTVAAIGLFREGVLSPVDATQPVRILPQQRPAPVHLDAAVGAGKENRRADVRAIQDRLKALRFLSQADYLREQVDTGRAEPLNEAALNATFGALARLRESAFGLPVAVPGRDWTAHGVVQPGDETHRLLSDPLAFGREPVKLSGSVGTLGLNWARDVRALQDRLADLRLLTQAEHAAEGVDPLRAAPVDEAAIPRTIAAIARLRQDLMGVAAPAVARVESVHPTLGRLNNNLFALTTRTNAAGSVGRGGDNHPGDVRAVQDSLRARGMLSQAHHTAEAVLPTAAVPVADATIANTIAAIVTFRQNVLGVPAPAAGLIGARIVTTHALASRRLDLLGSVGQGGDNRPREVRAVQDRLRDLRFLSQDRYRAEAASPAGAGPVADAAIPRTIDAIRRWQERVVGLPAPAPGVIQPLDVAIRMLNNPVLPVPADVAVAASVGPAGANNRQSDVRAVQDRLHYLGYLDTGDYLTERAPAGGAANVAAAAIPRTVQAIHRFQRTASGGTDDRVDANGHTERALEDPTFSTPTVPNPHTDYRNSGPAMPAFARPVQQIISAIEAHEAGGSTGEVPAILRNGSQTPASYGKAQMIGGTAVDTIRANPGFRDFYDLTAADVAGLADIATQTSDVYNNIFTAQVPAAVTEARLQADIAAYIAANLATFHANTCLGAGDIEKMFRTAQFRRQLAGFSPADLANLLNPAMNPDVVANVNALGFRNTDVNSYLTDQRRHGEHRAGFVTRALFHSRLAQILRDSVTDDSGFKLGRFLIRDNNNRVTNEEANQGVGLTDRQRAEITARIHNSGPAGLAGFVANPATAVNNYVNLVMGHWVP
ncbi:MAG: hypothetical protein HYY34_01835 [Chloroflexi bacterium]|nr:hypothetical protein [Chloroflexota bacterium]